MELSSSSSVDQSPPQTSAQSSVQSNPPVIVVPFNQEKAKNKSAKKTEKKAKSPAKRKNLGDPHKQMTKGDK
jgi:hypothetical protein